MRQFFFIAALFVQFPVDFNLSADLAALPVAADTRLLAESTDAAGRIRRLERHAGRCVDSQFPMQLQSAVPDNYRSLIFSGLNAMSADPQIMRYERKVHSAATFRN